MIRMKAEDNLRKPRENKSGALGGDPPCFP